MRNSNLIRYVIALWVSFTLLLALYGVHNWPEKAVEVTEWDNLPLEKKIVDLRSLIDEDKRQYNEAHVIMMKANKRATIRREQVAELIADTHDDLLSMGFRKPR